MNLNPSGGTEDYGLALVENAPAVVIQPEDDGTKKTEYSSVAAAIGALGDPVDGTPEKEYKGRIVAVLDGQGRAKWVVFVSDTPVLSSGVDNTNGNDRIVVDPNANTVEVTTVGDPDGIGSITSRIRKEMERLGYSEIVIEVNSDNEITKISGKRNGVTYTMKQLGAIRVLTPAEEVAEAGDKIEGMTAEQTEFALTVPNMAAGDDGEAAAKAAARNAIKAAVEASRAVGDPAPADTVETSNGFTLTFTWGAYDAPGVETEGSIVITSVAIAKGGETETISNITFTITALTQEQQDEIDAAEDQAAADAANAKIANAKAAIGQITLTATANASADTQDKAIALVKAAAEAKLNAAATDVEGVTVTVEAGTNANFSAPQNGTGTQGTAGVDGTVTVKITLSCTNGTDDVQDNVVIAIPAVAAS